MVQVLFASLLALAGGWLVANYLQNYGIDLSDIVSAASFAGVALDPIWYAHVTMDSITTPIIFLWIMTLLAVTYPAIKAALTIPVKAIHYR